MDTQSLTDRLKEQARRLGFASIGVCPAISPPGEAKLDEWLAAGYAGKMDYLANRRDAYRHPSQILKGVRSVVMATLAYRTTDPEPLAPGQGRVSRYAWGEADYHDLFRDRLHQLADWLREAVPGAATRCVVDTAPILERDFARLAGLGWIGKNTLLLNKPAGSWFFLGGLLTDRELAYDAPFETDHCGACTACLEACPTKAFPRPYVLDASRCISYLTIELREAIPESLRDSMGGWLFGCDICQEVCPWNGVSPESEIDEFCPRSDSNPMELTPLFGMTEEDFRRRFRKTPLWRSHRGGLLRNAAIALGNQRASEATGALIRGLSDEESIVRGACGWALGRIGSPEALAGLRQRLETEVDELVRAEITRALDSPPPTDRESVEPCD